MPIDPWPVNDGPGPSLIRLNNGGGMPPFAIPFLEQNRKDDPGIWLECGTASIKALFTR